MRSVFEGSHTKKPPLPIIDTLPLLSHPASSTFPQPEVLSDFGRIWVGYNPAVSFLTLSPREIFQPALVCLLFAGLIAMDMKAAVQDTKSKQSQRRNTSREDVDDYFKKWLNQDIVHIISEAERKVFQKLSTPEEKEQFIEQFWFRRDPDPRSAANEFKEEHYRRIAYANETFSSGIPGWITDRGRIYIIHGPPAEIESHPTGGSYDRPHHEGGGRTSTYPFEVWRYRYIEGIGTDIVIEFVDPTLSGEYRLALNPEEKDALLYVAGAGLTTLESMGLASKADRPFFSPGNTNYPFQSSRLADRAFTRYETYVQVQRATPVKYRDLKGLVEIDISFDNLPFSHRVDYFSLNQDRALVPLSAEIDNRELTFEPDGEVQRSRVAVYGIVTSLSNRVIDEFEADLVAEAGPRSGRSAFQRILLLERKGRYKLDLVIKDLNSGKVGVRRLALIPPPPKDDLAASSVLLSREVRQLERAPEQDEMFVLGDLHIRPSLDKVFHASDEMNLYLQVYNAAFDQVTMRPLLKLEYEIRRDGRPIVQELEEQGESVQFLSSQRVVLVRSFSLNEFEPGPYEVILTVSDLIQKSQVRVRDRFEVAVRVGR